MSGPPLIPGVAAEHNCPWCGQLNDAVTGLRPETTPSQGDVSICFACSWPGVFDGKPLAPRRPTHEELQAMQVDPYLQEVASKVAAFRRRGGES